METVNAHAAPTPLALLDRARAELAADTLAGTAGRGAAARYADRFDDLIRLIAR